MCSLLDVYEYVLKDILSNVSCVFTVRCVIPYKNQYLKLWNDSNVMEMFSIYEGQVDVYLDVMDLKIIFALSMHPPSPTKSLKI